MNTFHDFGRDGWAQDATGVPCLHTLIEAQAARAPQRTALRCDGRALSYAELNGRANHCARYLRELGVGPDAIVGVMMERSVEMVVALLGVLKAGGAYLPIDPAYPGQRVRFMLEDAGVAVVLTQARWRDRLVDFDGACCALDEEDWQRVAADLDGINRPHDLAYVIYTSGSTGKPKGCMIGHAAIVNRLQWMQRTYALGENDRVLQKTPFTFDVSVWEFFWPLLAGACLVMARPEGHRDNAYLIDTIRAEAVTVCHFVPSMLRLFVAAAGAEGCTTLRHLFCSGEALPFDLLCACRRRLPARLHNLYGPTEAAVDVSYWECEERADGKVPIGCAIDNVELRILDADRAPLPAGEEGELYIGGVALARGYLNRPELTRERFVDDPVHPGAKLYKTGDRARLLADGNIEYLGRLDFQVKLRGLRIELGEIEQTLREHAGVRAAAVLVRDADGGDPKLVAYVAPADVDGRALKRFAGERLPGYMVPNRIVALPELPVTVHGKLDRDALPWPPPAASAAPQTPAAVAQGGRAVVVAHLLEQLAELLPGLTLGEGDDLFDAGATSLTLVQLTERTRQRFGVAVPVDVVLDQPSLGAIADYVATRGAVPVPASERAGDGVRDEPLLAAFRQLLDAPALALDDDLFDAGATSLTMVQMVDDIARRHGVTVPVDVFLDRPTVRAIAAHVAGAAPIQATAPETAAGATAVALVSMPYRPSAYLPGRVRWRRQPLPGGALGRCLSLLSEATVEGKSRYLYPSTGNLNPVQAYVQVRDGGCDDCPGGEYYYHPGEHALYRIGAGSGAQPVAADADAAFTLLLVAEYRALAPIYQQDSAALAAVEAGYMAQLLLGRQHACGLVLAPSSAVDFAIARNALALQPSQQILLGLCGGLAAEEGEGMAAVARPARWDDPGFDTAVIADLVGPQPLTQVAMDALHQQHLQWRAFPPATPVIALARLPIDAADYRLRASQRDYLPQPVAFETLSGLLGLLRPAGDAAHWLYGAPASERVVQVYLYVKPERIDGLAGGTYRYDARRHRLVPIAAQPVDFEASYSAFNRQHYRRAAFCLMVVLPAGAPRLHGLLEAGHIGQLLMERQAEFDIGLCAIGGLRFDRLRGSFGLCDGDTLLHSFTGGRFEQPLPASRSRIVLGRGREAVAATAAAAPAAPAEIAIVGVAGRYPGADDLDAFWRNLRAGVRSFSTLPPDRAALLDAPDRVAGLLAGYLEQIDRFDSLLFNIAPAEARLLDPQERLLLEVAWECLERSGYSAAELRRRSGRVGVFVGSMWNDYQNHGVDVWREHGAIAASANASSLANRLSYVFDLDGPSLAVNTSCSSALTALHLACESVRRGECGAALVGGVNVVAHSFHQGVLGAIDFLAKDGVCRPLGADADGWTLGEGVGVLLLKPLADAERDGDHILGLVRATAIGHGAHGVRFGAPNPKVQAETLRRALAAADVAPSSIDYVETAATGASLADSAEISVLRAVIDAAPERRCLIGTVKANIGHLEAASAMSQIAKVLLQLQQGEIVPTLIDGAVSPLLQLEGSGLDIARAVQPWVPAADAGAVRPRRALINAFGANGAGGHVVIEEYRPSAAAVRPAAATLLPLSAATPAQLQQVAQRLLAYLDAPATASLADIALTLREGRANLRERVAVVASDHAELRERLAAFLRDECTAGLYRPGDGAADTALARNAQQWVDGGQPDWAGVAEGGRRVPLPTYPFERIRHWVRPPALPAAAAAPVVPAAPTADADALYEACVAHLRGLFAAVAELPCERIEAEQPLEHYGINSLMVHALNARLARDFGALPKTLFYEQPTLAGVATYLCAQRAEAVGALLGVASAGAPAPRGVTRPAAPMSRAVGGDSDAIAIIGLAGRYPRADGIEQFWENLREGLDCIGEIPAARWRHERYYAPEKFTLGKTYSKWGGFIDGADEFDPLFFGISPREAEIMDPQERLFLETAWQTCEDAGYSRAALQSAFGGRVGVFVGVMYGEYHLFSRDDALGGSSHGSIANRVSYFCDFNGPSLAVDTLCSSSLTALHLACASIRRGECEVALAGGVNLSLHPHKYLAHAQLTMSSSDGRCRSFGADGDGFVPGEGVGAVLLKPLQRAIADGDHIYGVIRASAVNHGGKTNGYTVPNPNAQGAVIAQALAEAGIDARSISYVEAHGTGTSLGDPIEIAGLVKAFAPHTQDSQFCAIGSVKSNIGHCESAAGIAGLTKVLLQMKHGTLVPSLHAQTLNPHIDFADSPFFVQQSCAPWPSPAAPDDGQPLPRLAALSSFGAGGANAHVLVEEYRDETIAGEAHTGPALIVLSAKSEAALRAQARRLLAAVAAGRFGEDDLADIAYTLQVGRDALEWRLAFSASDLGELRDRLDAIAAGQVPAACHWGEVRRGGGALAVFGADDDLRDALGKWLERGKYDKLLALWVQGLAFDWSALHAGRRRRRLSLPTYPFERQRYWLPESGEQAGAGAGLHPLLQRNTSDLDGLRFSSGFSGEEFFFADHRVGGAPVLPGAAYLEMALAAAAQVRGNADGLRLCDVTWLSPLAAAAAGTVHTALTPREDGAIDFRIYTDVGAGPVVHAQGRIEAGPQPESVALDLAVLRARGEQHFDAERCYAAFATQGIVYGPAHRGLGGVAVGTDDQGNWFALAEVALPPSVRAGAAAYRLHPALIDAALQAAIGLRLAVSGELQPALPFALARVEVLRACPAPAVVVVRANADAAQTLDIELCGDDGVICVRLLGFCARAAAVATTGPTLLAPLWTAAPAVVGPQLPAAGAKILLWCGSEGQRRALRERYPNAQVLALADDSASDALAEAIAALGAIDHVFWIAPASAAQPAEPEALLAGQRRVVLAGFRLIKALLALGCGTRPLGFTALTVRAEAVWPGEPARPAQAGVAGLIGALAKEYPHWRVRLLDLGEADGWPLDELLRLPADPRGDAWAHRHGRWHRLRLAPCAAPAASGGFRRDGVYVVVGGAGGIGAAFSEYLLRRYGARIVWIGRRPLDTAIGAQQEALAALGQAPDYLVADAADRAALERAYATIKQRYGAIHGVVNAALVLADKSLDQMDEAGFEAALRAKADVSVRIAEVFAAEPLDWILFFSSLQSFAKGAGQSNYAAGCTFADAFAEQLGQHCPFPVKVMHWGYWGGVGSVAAPAYRARMAAQGIGSIEPAAAMAALETLLGGPQRALGLLQAEQPGAIAGADAGDAPTVIADAAPALASRLAGGAATVPAAVTAAALSPQRRAIDALSLRLLRGQLQALGLGVEAAADVAVWSERAGLAPRHQRWLEESLALLAAQGLVDFRDGRCVMPADVDLAADWAEWERNGVAWLRDGEVAARVQLLDAALRALPDILTGRRAATEVLFPDASVALVEGIYQRNRVSDYFNAVLADSVVEYVRARLAVEPAARLRLLEIGAGTGATSAALFQRLAPFADHIEEYAYTDISRAFLLHGEQTYRAAAPYLRCELFDVEKPLAGQTVGAGYDLAIATNVLHATADIRRTLRNVKATLRRNGLLLINELASRPLFTHLTFGLLDGWWRYEDAALRVPGSPVLYPEQWRAALAAEGFAPVMFPAQAAHGLGQQVVVAVSDGVVHQPAAPVAVAPVAAAPAVTAVRSLPVQQVAVAASSGDHVSVRERLVAHLKKLVGAKLKLAPAQIDGAAALSSYGIDSILVVQLTNDLGQALPDVTSTVFFEHPSVDALADHFLREQPEAVRRLVGATAAPPAAAQALPRVDAIAAAPRRLSPWQLAPQPAATDAATADAVAIIGLAGRYPQARNVAEFWRNLRDGRHCIVEVPPERWDWRERFSEEKGRWGSIYSKWGGFIDGIDEFDPLFFQIAPRDAANMDPQERLFLQEAYACVEDAGYTPATVCDGNRVGVFVGVMNGTYTRHSRYWSIANRVSYLFDFHGPSLVVDTACSSSLTALHLAIESLRSGTSECAIAGGVNLIVDPVQYQTLSAATMLSSGNACRSFGAGADGFVDGEGVGAALLKPLQRALADGDHIYGVIRGSMINAGGRTNGYTVPNPAAQAQVVAEALQRAGVDARSVSYIEAHGTGTALGDPIEVAGLVKAFAAHTQDKQFCAIGSVKSNIGHCESAAGIAGLTKVLLQMKHATLAPSLHAEDINPHIDFAAGPFALQREAAPWPRPVLSGDGVARELPRIAGISSFGAGGANAHVIVEEAPAVAPAVAAAGPALVPLSALDEERLRERAADLLRAIEAGQWQPADLPRIAYTLQVGREAMPSRLALLVGSLDELADKLRRYGAGETEIDGCYVGEVKRREALARLIADEDIQVTVDAWFAKGKLGKLLESWVSGLAVDWQRLHGADRPRRIALPTYPFARKRYWKSAEIERALAVPTSASPPETVSIVPPASAADVVPNTVVATAEATPRSLAQLEAELAASLAEALMMDSAELDPDRPFVELGVDSIIGVEWVRALNQRYDIALAATKVYDHPTLRELAALIQTTAPAAAVPLPAIAPVISVSPGVTLAPLAGAMPAAAAIPVAAPVGRGEAAATLLQELSATLAEALMMDSAELDIDKPFVELGLDSIIGVEWVRALNQRYGIALVATKVYDHPTLRELAAFLAGELADRPAVVQELPGAPAPAVATAAAAVQLMPLNVNVRPSAGESASEAKALAEDVIAIVGIAGRYPGAQDLTAYWDNLAQGRNSVREIPAERWDVARYFDPRPGQRDKIYCKWLGALDDIDCFDPLFFGLAPADAELMDPQQRLFLQEAYRAIEDAGIDPRALSERQCGVYLGLMSNEYGQLLHEQGYGASDTTGNSAAIAAARIAYHLNLKGPALSVDTACSSSLVATHLACQALRSGEIDMALAGGVTLYLMPESYLGMCGAGMLSPAGQCKAMDNSADGFVPGEGVGVLVLKRLRDAQRDGDRIYATIVGSGINQDGKTNGITAPNVKSQVALERAVYARYGIDPDTISYVELHGTGTKLGDPIELEALATVFGERTQRRQFCALGSVKSNIGHTSAAAGVAGVQKVLLSLQHGELVPTLHYRTPNEHFDFANSPFYVNTERRAWRSEAGQPRRAAVSSFGFSGTNAHLVLEEYRGAAARPTAPGPVLLVLSAKNSERLREQARRLHGYLSAQVDVDLAAVAYTLQVGREALPHRLAFVADDAAAAQATLAAFAATGEAAGAWSGRARPGTGGEALAAAWSLAGAARLAQLAERWVQGAAVAWSRLYETGTPQRLALPTYAFAEERYWVPTATATVAIDPGFDEAACSRLLDDVKAERLSIDAATTTVKQLMAS